MTARNPSTSTSPLASLVSGVELLSLDAGNTIIFLDHARLARLLGAHGFAITAEALIVAEGAAKLAQEEKRLEAFAWKHEALPGARGWGGMVGTMLQAAGVPREKLAAIVTALWDEHVDLNLWSLVPEGLTDALSKVRARGVKVAVVSNSEGMLEELFARLGLLPHVDLLVDSGNVGVEKPDPKIFRRALEPFGIAPEHALHLGDLFATDIVGARAAGMRYALIDPYGHCEGRHLDVPRVPSVAAVCEAMLALRV